MWDHTDSASAAITALLLMKGHEPQTDFQCESGESQNAGCSQNINDSPFHTPSWLGDPNDLERTMRDGVSPTRDPAGDRGRVLESR